MKECNNGERVVSTLDLGKVVGDCVVSLSDRV